MLSDASAHCINKSSNMKTEKPKKFKKSFFFGLIVGAIGYGIFEAFIWPLFS